MIIVEVNLKTNERRILAEYSDPRDRPIADAAQYILPAVLERIYNNKPDLIHKSHRG
ncbi:MAG: hypothetical protein H6Q73_3812 [Firmicutes bacterium]|nr:hypothetical protein [Bacillota bacterium]